MKITTKGTQVVKVETCCSDFFRHMNTSFKKVYDAENSLYLCTPEWVIGEIYYCPFCGEKIEFIEEG